MPTSHDVLGGSHCCEYRWGIRSADAHSHKSCEYEGGMLMTRFMFTAVLLVACVGPSAHIVTRVAPSTAGEGLAMAGNGQPVPQHVRKLASPTTGAFVATMDSPRRLPMTPMLRFAMGRYARRLAVTIGIDSYQSLPKLKVARSDARHISDRLSAMGFEVIAQLEDGQATRAGIMKLLRERMPEKIGPNDLVLVYFAGHGFSEGDLGYLVPQDADSRVTKTAVSMHELKDSALRWPNRHTMFVVDACFSGAMFRHGAATAEENPLRYWEARSEHRLIEILTAGNSGELAVESGEWGVFSRAFDRGLSGEADANRDGVVSGKELGVFTEATVRAVTGDRQHPQWGSVEGQGSVLFWDARRVPGNAHRVTRFLNVPGLKAELLAVHRALDRQQWQEGERLLRELMLQGHKGGGLNLILAELYLAQDALGNGQLVKDELDVAADQNLDVTSKGVLLELNARLQKARRGAF